jgi:hypothetical protein
VRGPAAPEAPQPATALFNGGGEEAERDLDVPAFMRRLKF